MIFLNAAFTQHFTRMPCRPRSAPPRQSPAPRCRTTQLAPARRLCRAAGRAPPATHRPALAIDHRPAPETSPCLMKSATAQTSRCPTIFWPPSRPLPQHKSSPSCPACGRRAICRWTMATPPTGGLLLTLAGEWLADRPLCPGALRPARSPARDGQRPLAQPEHGCRPGTLASVAPLATAPAPPG